MIFASRTFGNILEIQCGRGAGPRGRPRGRRGDRQEARPARPRLLVPAAGHRSRKRSACNKFSELCFAIGPFHCAMPLTRWPRQAPSSGAAAQTPAGGRFFPPFHGLISQPPDAESRETRGLLASWSTPWRAARQAVPPVKPPRSDWMMHSGRGVVCLHVTRPSPLRVLRLRVAVEGTFPPLRKKKGTSID